MNAKEQLFEEGKKKKLTEETLRGNASYPPTQDLTDRRLGMSKRFKVLENKKKKTKEARDPRGVRKLRYTELVFIYFLSRREFSYTLCIIWTFNYSLRAHKVLFGIPCKIYKLAR